jgi:hypothetical protein
MNLTDAEFFLLGWAVAATIGMFKYREEAKSAKWFAKAMIERADVREKVLREFEKFKEKHGL